MTDSIPDLKKSLRAKMQAAREQVTAEEAKAAKLALAKHLVPFIPKGATVGGYRAMRGEINPTEALAQLATRGHDLCLPVIEELDSPLIFRRWQLNQPLQKGRFGIEVPVEETPIITPDVVLVPLLAFDKKGYRLGYGAGFYDRTIELLRTKKRSQFIGVAFALQEMEKLPIEPHDAKLDAIVTESGVRKFA